MAPEPQQAKSALKSKKRALDELDALFDAKPGGALQSAKRRKTIGAVPSASVSISTSVVRKPAPKTATLPSLPVGLPAQTAVGGPLYEYLYGPLPPDVLSGTSAEPTPLFGTDSSAQLAIFLASTLNVTGQLQTAVIDRQIKNKSIILENSRPQIEAQRAVARAERQAKRRTTGLSNKKLKQKGLMDIGKDLKLQDFAELHTMWQSYMKQILHKCKTSKKSMSKVAAQADLQGSFARVTAASAESYVGFTGIVLVESPNTLQMLTATNRLRRVPKKGTTFQFAVGDIAFSLSGDAIVGRSPFKGWEGFGGMGGK